MQIYEFFRDIIALFSLSHDINFALSMIHDTIVKLKFKKMETTDLSTQFPADVQAPAEPAMEEIPEAAAAADRPPTDATSPLPPGPPQGYLDENDPLDDPLETLLSRRRPSVWDL